MRRSQFLKISGKCALLFSYTRTFGGIIPLEKMMSTKELKSRCIAVFDRFEEVWEFNDFWKRGNTFDACLHFVSALQQRWPNDDSVKAVAKKVDGMLVKNLQYFKTFDPGDMWADDFGWWGLMGLNARKHLLQSGNEALAARYLELSKDLCWKQQKDHAYDASNSARPVPHGCSNGDAKGRDKGVKNTVTNVLVFLLSVKIFRLLLSTQDADKDKYLDMAYRQWQWFDRWFRLPQYEYLKNTSPGGALVNERPTAFFDGSDYTSTTHPTWEKGWLWTGDQGMLLAALTEMSSIKDNLATWIAENKIDPNFHADEFAASIHKYISLLGRGIETTLFSEKDNIVREAPFKASMGPEFGNDYLPGRGIMLRYLGALDKKITGIDFTKHIEATAEAIWMTRDVKENQVLAEFTSPENDRLFIDQFRRNWGMADEIMKWQIANMNPQQKFAVCQSIGLDALGALVRAS
jgi:hypothetical protein